MKKSLTILFMLAAIAIAVPAVYAQTVHDQIAFTRAQINADRQAIVTATLKLTDDESKKFWPMYRDYRADMDKPLDRAWNLLTTYGEKWDSMSDEDAAKLLDEYLQIEEQMVSIKQKWAKKMSKEFKGVTTARFFQIENKLDTMLRLDGVAEIPLVTKKQ